GEADAGGRVARDHADGRDGVAGRAGPRLPADGDDVQHLRERVVMERNKNDVWVGLFVLIGGAALVFLALQAANLLTLSFQPTYRLAAQFDNIGGLKPRAAVKSSGVVVGRVE